NVGTGNPLDVTVNDDGVPTSIVAAVALVIAGASLTDRKKVCVSVPTAFVARIVNKYCFPVPASGVPEMVPAAALNVRPAGKVPMSDSDGAGLPVAVTLNVDALPTLNVAALTLVIFGAVPVMIASVTSAVFESALPL